MLTQCSGQTERRPVLKRFFRRSAGLLFIFSLSGGAVADDLYPEIKPSQEVSIGNVIYLWGTLKHGCGQTQSCSGTCTHFAGFFLQQVATCARLCTEIPGGKRVKQQDGQDVVQVSARNRGEGEYLDCRKEGGGSFDPGICPIGSASWDGSDYTQDTGRYCVKMKNWDPEQARDFSASIELE